VRGALGNLIAALEYDKAEQPVAWRHGVVDGVSLLPNVWYEARDGALRAIKENP
jgi:hypothetical protein